MELLKLNKMQQFIEGNLSYQEASSLFFEFAKNKQYALRLMSSNSIANARQLAAEFKNILRQQPNYYQRLAEGLPGIEQVEIKSTAPTITPTFTIPDAHEKPLPNSPESKIFNGQRPSSVIEENAIVNLKELLRKRGSLHGRLLESHDKERLFEIAHEMMSFQRQINKVKFDIENIRKGAIPAVSTIVNSTLTSEEFKRISNLNNYLRRERNALKKATTETQRNKIQSKIEKFQTELNELARKQKTTD